MYDAWRAYLEVAMGLTQASRRKAEQIARDLIGRGGATASQLQTTTEELLAAGRANREALAKLVRYELERALGAVGLASADEVRGLEERVRRLERELRAVGRPRTGGAAQAAAAETAAPGTGGPAAPQAPGTQAPQAAEAAAKKAAARKPAVKKATVKKAAAKRAPAAKKAAGRLGGTSREQA